MKRVVTQEDFGETTAPPPREEPAEAGKSAGGWKGGRGENLHLELKQLRVTGGLPPDRIWWTCPILQQEAALWQTQWIWS